MTIDATALPRHQIQAGTQLYRIHRWSNGPWFFSGDGLGRFDPTGIDGFGACYLTEDPLGAWVESFRTTMTLLEDDVRLRAITTMVVSEPIEVVDLAHRRALAAGVTAAVTAGADYGESHALAGRMQPNAMGVRWRVRHDLAQDLVGVALFGPRGPQSDDYFAETSTEPIGRELIREAEEAFGYRVMPVSAR